MKNSIRETRRKAGLRQAELARKAGIAEAQLCRIEGGLRPSYATAEKVAKALQVSVDSLFPPGTELVGTIRVGGAAQ